ncbi:hypothetical protein EG68_11682 [Paragonimus skrjabini miyazakii]|uniref:Uncharacterized protein n=1 Tax=Paragonimus skrjabini miyazakii TaxID=59628 RepID=A0A8S9Y877_9TREM|nr:hypothetical protein EG68_11682 [Paragonimus skrjabini miyazakii]
MYRMLHEKLESIAQKYAHEFENCDVIRICDLQVETPGDFLSTLTKTLHYPSILSFSDSEDVDANCSSPLADLSLNDVDEELDCAMSRMLLISWSFSLLIRAVFSAKHYVPVKEITNSSRNFGVQNKHKHRKSHPVRSTPLGASSSPQSPRPSSHLPDFAWPAGLEETVSDLSCSSQCNSSCRAIDLTSRLSCAGRSQSPELHTSTFEFQTHVASEDDVLRFRRSVRYWKRKRKSPVHYRSRIYRTHSGPWKHAISCLLRRDGRYHNCGKLTTGNLRKLLDRSRTDTTARERIIQWLRHQQSSAHC